MNKKLIILIMFLVVLVVPFKVYGEEKDGLMTIQNENTKSKNAYLSNITLSEGKIDFKKDKKNYIVGIPYTVDSLIVSAVPEDERANVLVTGNSTLQFGKNIYEITVTAEDGTTSIYKVIAYKLHEGETIDNNYLSSLIIIGHNIKFDKNVTNYTIPIKSSEPLKFNIILEDPNSTYQVINNENLMDKSQVLIIVTARDESKRIYTITTTKADDTNYPLLIGLITLGGILAMTLVLLLYFQYRKRKTKKMLGKIKKQNVISGGNKKETYDFNISHSNETLPNQDPTKTVVINSDIETSQKNNNNNDTEIL